MEVTQYNIGEVVVNITSEDESWRLIHDNVSVIALFESVGKTESIYQIVLASDKQTLLNEISRLNLVVTEDVADLYDIEI